ncbi:MAG: pseudouridine synthase [Bacillota bacterium]
MRLAKYLAGAGVASRRKAEQIIQEGRVWVNGTVTILPQTLVTGSDDIRVDGSPVKKPSRYYYLLLDKPPGYLSTVSDTHDRPTVLDLVREIPERVYPVGRLDADTTGLLLLTNDGELAFRLAHPRYEVEKTYRAWVKGTPAAAALAQLAGGVSINGEKTLPAKVKLVRKAGVQRSLLEITLTEGKKRQVKLMCSAVGHDVLKLRRVRYAFLTALRLQSGEYRHLKRDEVKRLYRLVGLKYGL